MEARMVSGPEGCVPVSATGIASLIREGTTGSIPETQGRFSDNCYAPLQREDTELGPPVDCSLSGIVDRYDSRSRDVRTEEAVGVDGQSPYTIRGDLRTVGMIALILLALAGLARASVAFQEAKLKPEDADSGGTLHLFTSPGEGECVPWGGHVHPNGIKCCSESCVTGDINYCGADTCAEQGPNGIANCCGDTDSVPFCEKGHLAPCRLPHESAEKPPEKKSSSPGFVGSNEKVKSSSKGTLAAGGSSAAECRIKETTCDGTYYGVTDSREEVCCDRECQEHCGSREVMCDKTAWGAALCCTKEIKENGVKCMESGISPCVLEPYCPDAAEERAENFEASMTIPAKTE